MRTRGHKYLQYTIFAGTAILWAGRSDSFVKNVLPAYGDSLRPAFRNGGPSGWFYVPISKGSPERRPKQAAQVRPRRALPLRSGQHVEPVAANSRGLSSEDLHAQILQIRNRA